MYVGWLAVALGWYQLQIGMSFESDKSSSYFTQGVWRRFNGAISRFPAGKNAGNSASFHVFLFSDCTHTAARDLCRVSGSIPFVVKQTSVGHHAGAARNFLRN